MNKMFRSMCESCEMEPAAFKVTLDEMTFNVCEGCKPTDEELSYLLRFGEA